MVFGTAAVQNKAFMLQKNLKIRKTDSMPKKANQDISIIETNNAGPPIKIIFVSDRNLDPQIDGPNGMNYTDFWTINSDGTGATPITRNDWGHLYFELSPDKTKILFSSSHDFAPNIDDTLMSSNIWVINSDGSNPTPLTKLTAFGVNCSDSRWSPDGKKIVFSSQRDLNPLIDATGTSGNLWVMDADGKNQQPLTKLKNAIHWTPQWSPDGTKIIFNSNRDLDQTIDNVVPGGGFNIWVMNADGTGLQALTTDSLGEGREELIWSPDSTKIAFSSKENRLWTVDVNGKNLKKLLNMKVVGPQWSPDGTMIAFSSDEGTIATNVWITTADGKIVKPLAKQDTAHTNNQDLHVRWAADSKLIFFHSNRNLDPQKDDAPSFARNIWAVNINGNARPITRLLKANNYFPEL